MCQSQKNCNLPVKKSFKKDKYIWWLNNEIEFVTSYNQYLYSLKQTLIDLKQKKMTKNDK